jgi:hypothetical protein
MDSVDYWSQPNLGTRIKMTKGGFISPARRRLAGVEHQKAGI